jgi:tetratricopeptide (TPR) repeat protein
MRLGLGDRLGPYDVLGHLGSGGMGSVYRARDSRLNRQVALKLLADELAADPDARARLEREALSAAALDHPFICKIFEIGEHPIEGGVPFLVLEYIAGGTLRDRLRAGRMPSSEVLRIASEIAEALEAAHARGFVHRDLKPENIMLTEQGHVKVMDFGLARPIASAADPARATMFVTSPGIVVGTPAYMSPEQHKGLDVDGRSDLFAFGAILAELLSGRHPFAKQTPAETLAAILTAPPDFGTQVDLDVTAQRLLVVSRRLLAKAADDRYASITDVRAELARLVTPSEISAASIAAGAAADDRLPPTIGRDAELAQLMRLVDEAMAGRGSVVLIAGEPGIGKSHLSSALLDAARRRGAHALAGHCYEMEGSPPYVPFAEHVEDAGRLLPRDTFRHVLGDEASEVARIMPELRRLFADIPPPTDLPPEQQRRYLFNAYREFAARLARLSPVVAIVEDLHWADGPTLLLLQHIAQVVAGVPMLIVGTYRDQEVALDAPLAATLEFLARQKIVTRMTLRRWSTDEVHRMLAALCRQEPPASLAPVIFEETEGNPFFVAEVFHHLAEEGALFDASGSFLQDLRVERLRVPDSVRLVVGRRLERLTAGARRVLTTGAVVGRGFALALLEDLEAADSGRDGVLDAIEEAERARLIESEPSGRNPRYRFVHEIVRQTLIDAMSPRRRQRLHLRIAAGIERTFASALDSHAPALAYHLYNAGPDAPPEKTIHYLSVAAGRANAAAAHEEALDHLDKALALLETPVSPLAAGLLVPRANALQSLGRADEAIETFERALSVFDALGDVGHYVETCVPLLHLYTFALRPADMQSLVARAAEKAQGGPLGPRGVVLAMRAVCSSVGGMIDAALADLDELHTIPPQELPPSIVGFATMLEVHVRDEAGQMDLAEAVARRATQMLESSAGYWREAIAYGLYEPPLYRGNPIEAERLARESIQRSTRLGADELRQAAVRSLADIRLANGDLAGAEQVGREALSFSESIQGGGITFAVQTTLAGTLHLRDRSAEAVPLLQSAVRRCLPFFAGYPDGLLALSLTVLGAPDADAAIDAAMKWLPGAGRSRGLGSWHAVSLLVEALRHRNRRDEAARLIEQAERAATEWDSNHYAFPVRSAAAIAAACAGDWARSEAHHRASIARMDEIPYVTASPIARFWYADMLIDRGGAGDAAAAAALLEKSIECCDAIGLALYARLGRQRLAQVS